MDDWDEYKVKQLSKKDFKVINKAIKKTLDDKTEFRFRDQLKWCVIAILDEIQEIEDILFQENTAREFDKIFVRKPIELVPLPRSNIDSICTNIEKDKSFRLLV
jgi:hypothetical protein